MFALLRLSTCARESRPVDQRAREREREEGNGWEKQSRRKEGRSALEAHKLDCGSSTRPHLFDCADSRCLGLRCTLVKQDKTLVALVGQLARDRFCPAGAISAGYRRAESIRPPAQQVDAKSHPAGLADKRARARARVARRPQVSRRLWAAAR